MLMIDQVPKIGYMVTITKEQKEMVEAWEKSDAAPDHGFILNSDETLYPSDDIFPSREHPELFIMGHGVWLHCNRSGLEIKLIQLPAPIEA